MNLHTQLLLQEISGAKSVLTLSLSHLEQAQTLAPLNSETAPLDELINDAVAHVRYALKHLDMVGARSTRDPLVQLSESTPISENNEQA